MREKIKVLLLASDASDGVAAIRLDHEARGVVEAIRKARGRDTIEFAAEWGVQVGDLQNALLWHRPQVVHFAGHGGPDGIRLDGGDMGERIVGGEELRDLFSALKCVRVVLLNACETQPLARALAAEIDYAIGMNREVDDTDAALFSAGFYGALASGATVEEAFRLGVNRMRLEGSDAFTTPVLEVRKGVDTALPLVAPSGRGTDQAEDSDPEGETGDSVGADVSRPGAGLSFHGTTIGTFNLVEGDHAVIHNAARP